MMFSHQIPVTIFLIKDSTKNYDFGGSKLSTNPITNPVNSYQFNFSKYRQPVVLNMAPTRNIGSSKMREVGNNIMK